jgi:hypothetical protein
LIQEQLGILDNALANGASDAALLRQVGRIEQSLSSRILNGDLWLNKADAELRNIGPYKP